MTADPGPWAWPVIALLVGILLGYWLAHLTHPRWTCVVQTAAGPVNCAPS